MFGNGRRNAEEKKVFIDLEGYSEPGEDRSLCVKAIELRYFKDLKAISDLAYQGNILVIEASHFAEGEERRREAIIALKSLADDREGSFSEVSDRVIVLTPSGVGVDRCRIIRRGANNGV